MSETDATPGLLLLARAASTPSPAVHLRPELSMPWPPSPSLPPPPVSILAWLFLAAQAGALHPRSQPAEAGRRR
ncbi:FAD-binding monooxygenase aflW [Fusarium oxysporum f. sp. albedinis]|nr:FAD-binding monooxygenase aflW [Fusarium oxysporum f. sp. albedinis]